MLFKFSTPKTSGSYLEQFVRQVVIRAGRLIVINKGVDKICQMSKEKMKNSSPQGDKNGEMGSNLA